MILKITLISIIIFIIFCIISLIVFYKDIEKKMKNKEKMEYINFSSKTIFNKDIDSSIFAQKKITMINIWATYCPCCLKGLTYLQEIYEKFKDKNIGFLGIVSDLKLDSYTEKDLKRAIKMVKENDVKYNNIFADKIFIEYAKGKLFVIPTTVFVDNKGNVIREILESRHSKEKIIDIINQILNKE